MVEQDEDLQGIPMEVDFEPAAYESESDRCIPPPTSLQLSEFAETDQSAGEALAVLK